MLLQYNPSSGTTLRVYAQGASGNAIETGGSEGTVHLGSNTVNTKVNEILRITGKGTTSSTTAFLVQNANASASLSVKDDGTTAVLSSNENPFTVSHTNGSSKFGIVLGNGSAIAAGQAALRLNDSTNVFTFDGSRIIAGLPMTVGQATGTFRISGGGGGTVVASPAIFLTDNTYNAGGYTVTSGTQTTVQIGGFGAASNAIWKPASGNANYNLLVVAPNMSGSGTYSGIIRGIYYAPTVDSTIYGAHRAIETTAGDVIVNGGKVGIGISTPTASLHISGAAATPLLRVSNPASVDFTIQSDSTLTDYTGLYWGTDYKFLSKQSATLFVNIDSNINFSNGFVTKTTMNSSGQLGIGITSAANILATAHVKGSGTTSSTTALLVQNANASSSLTVLDNGNVGIGTTTPGSTLPNGWGSGGYVLEVLGPTNESSGIFLRRGNFIGIGLDLWSNNGNGSSYIDNRYDSSGATGITLRIRTSGTPRIVAAFDDEFGAKLGDWTNNRTNAVRVEGDLSFRSGGGSRTITGPVNTSLILNALPLNSNEGVILQYSGSTGFILNNSGNVGIGRTTPAYRLDVSGSGRFTNNLIVTGSFTVATGSSVEFQVNQTGVKIGNASTDSHSITGSIAISSSASTSSAALLIYKSGSTVLDIQGSQGQLFSVIDALSGSLMSVNDVSGLPILEVFSDDRVVMGTYGAPGLIISGSTATVATGSSAPAGTAPEGTFKFAVVGGLYYIYAYVGGAWRSGSLS
jgi:hypothetical protein